MIHLRYLQIFMILILMFISCDFSEENINEEAVTEATLDELFEPAVAQIAFNQSAISGRTAGLLMQYFAENDGTFSPLSSYSIPNNYMNTFWNSGLYTGSLMSINDLQILGEKEGNTDLEAIALILKVKEFLHATTLFGDIPFTEALKGSEQIYPIFDTQEFIYQSLLEMSDDAIELIGSNGVNNTLADVDIIYNGDMASWKRFAYGLKARLHLHLASNGGSNFNQVLSSLENSFSSYNQQPTFRWLQYNSVENPLQSFAIDRPSTFKISETYANLMGNKNDPRKESITTLNNNQWLYYDSSTELYWSSQNSSLPFLSFVELRFMKAEALLETGADDSDVLDALREGIEASFLQMGIDQNDYQEYLATYATFDGMTSKKEKLEHIISEAYSAYYGYAFQQSWNNYKRLKIPNLEPTGFSNEFDPSGTIPVRFLYPEFELDLNPVNTQEAIDRQNGALLDEPLWIFQ